MSFFSEQLSLYAYLLRAYSKFRAVGRCPGSPLVVHLQTQSSCNGRCLACPHPMLRGKGYEEGAMEWDLFASIADQLASESLLSRVSFHLHNEPLLDERIFEWVRHFKSKGTDKTSRLVTNGELLDRFPASDIIGSGLDDLTISLNAHSRETYEAVNAGISYDRVMANVESVLSNLALRDRVSLSFLVSRRNEDEVDRAIRYWRSRGVGTRVVQMTNRAGALEDFEGVRPDTPRSGGSVPSRLLRGPMDRVRQAAGCTLPFCQMNILFNGDCIVCCHDWNRASVVGNARTTPLREIWNGNEMNEIRRLVLRKEYDRVGACRGCSEAR